VEKKKGERAKGKFRECGSRKEQRKEFRGGGG